MDKNKLIAIGALVGVGIVMYLTKAPLQMDDDKPQPKPAAAGTPDPKAVKELGIKDTKVGIGPAAAAGDSVSMLYTGKLTDGTVFDSTSKRNNEPFTFTLGGGQVIKGWDLGIVGMKKGGKRTLTIPGDLAYGAAGQGSIPPNATLIFDVEMLTINKKK